MRRFPEIHEERLRLYSDESSAAQWLDSPFSLWIELSIYFDRAYESDDMPKVAAIYQFADWCGQRSADLGDAVAACLYEHIPTNEKARKDMPKWFTLEEVLRMRQLFSYLVGHEGFLEILSEYPEASWLPDEQSR